MNTPNFRITVECIDPKTGVRYTYSSIEEAGSNDRQDATENSARLADLITRKVFERYYQSQEAR